MIIVNNLQRNCLNKIVIATVVEVIGEPEEYLYQYVYSDAMMPWSDVWGNTQTINSEP